MSGLGFDPRLLRPQRSVLTTRRSGSISKPTFSHFFSSKVFSSQELLPFKAVFFSFFLVFPFTKRFSLSELLPVILLFRRERLFPSTAQHKILSRPGFEPGLLRPQRSVLTPRRSGPISKPPFLALFFFGSFFVIRVGTSYSVVPS